MRSWRPLGDSMRQIMVKNRKLTDVWLHFGSLFGAETGVKSEQKTALKSEGTFRDFWAIPGLPKRFLAPCWFLFASF